MQPGLPIDGLSAKQREQVAHGNSLLDTTLDLIDDCPLHNVAVILENPQKSLIWKMQRLHAIMNGENSMGCQATVHNCDFCQYGTPWKRPTKIPECEARVLHVSRRLALLCSTWCSGRFSEVSETGPEFLKFLKFLKFVPDAGGAGRG